MKKRFVHTPSKSEISPDYIFETKDVLQLTGVPVVYLNKLVERESFGIRPSVRTGAGKGSRRLFITPDLYSISLVWWLSESGLRSEVIQRVFADLLPGGVVSANNAAGLLLSRQHSAQTPLALVIRRELGWGKNKKRRPKQRVVIVPESKTIVGEGLSGTLIVPVGRLLLDLTARIKEFRPEGMVE